MSKIQFAGVCGLLLGASCAIPEAIVDNSTSTEDRGISTTYFSDGLDSGSVLLERVEPNIDHRWGSGLPEGLDRGDYFSARWEGWIEPTEDGVYTFVTRSDDGVRLWVGDMATPVIERWSLHSEQRDTADVELVANERVPIKLEFYEGPGTATIDLLWIPPSQTSEEIIGQEHFFQDEITDESGIMSTYFAGTRLDSPIRETRVEMNIQHRWGRGSPDGLDLRNRFSVRWEGWLEPPESGEYTFVTLSDDGVRLWVGDMETPAIDRWSIHPEARDTAVVTLTANERVPFKLEFYEHYGIATIELHWIRPGQTTEEIIGPEHFFQTEQPTSEARCAEAQEHTPEPARLSCPSGMVITGIEFASYGTPTGDCGSYETSACHSETSRQEMIDRCVGQAECSVLASNDIFGDPCRNTQKRLRVQYACSSPNNTDSDAGPPQQDPPPGPCDGVICGANASCQPSSGVCACDEGYVDRGGSCELILSGDPAGRTRAEVCEMWNRGHVENSPMHWTVGAERCDPGTMDPVAIDDTLRRVVMFRWLAGLPPVDHDASRHQEMMECAHIMNLNWRLGDYGPTNWHDPPPDAECYTEGGAAAAGRSLLAIGYATPGASIDGYMSDVGTPSLGHRRWILGEHLTSVEIGSSDRGYCLGVLGGGGSTERAWIAYPNPGPAPIFLGMHTWSFYANHFDVGSAYATIEDEHGTNLPVHSYLVYGGGVGFTPDGWTPTADQTYRVTIHDTELGDITYETTLVDC